MLSVVDLQDQAVLVTPQPSRLSHEQKLGPEDPCLLVGALGELSAAHAAGEPEIVADQRARSRLPTDPSALDHECRQSLRRGIHRGGQTGGARADDRDVEIALGAEPRVHAERARQFGVGGVDEHARIAQDRHRRLGLLLSDSLQ